MSKVLFINEKEDKALITKLESQFELVTTTFEGLDDYLKLENNCDMVIAHVALSSLLQYLKNYDGNTHIAPLQFVLVDKYHSNLNQYILNGMITYYFLYPTLDIESIISKINKEELEYTNSKRLSIYEKSIREAIKLLISDLPEEQMMDEILQKFALCVDAKRAKLFIEDGEYFKNIYEWASNENLYNKDKEYNQVSYQKMPKNILGNSFSRLQKDELMIIDDMKSLNKTNPKAYALFSKQEVNNLVGAPIKIKDKMIGFITATNYNENYLIYKDLLISISTALGTYFDKLEYQKKLEYDQLTGLLKKESFFEKAKKLIQNNNDLFSLVKLDIKNFRYINQMYGQEFGDHILKSVSKFLDDQKIPVKGLVGRDNNNDGFYLLTTSSYENIKLTIQESMPTFIQLMPDLNFKLAFGYYYIEDKNESSDVMDTKVTLALKKAKSIPEENIVLYTEELSYQLIKEQNIINEFANALKNDEFKIYIQPKYDTLMEKYFGGEVLCRWVKNGEIISPGEFIPVLEKHGLISRLDMHMFTKTLKMVSEWIEKGYDDIPLSINFSRFNFLNKNIFERIVTLIDSYKVPHNLIIIEITESAYVEQEHTLIPFINKCKEVGIKVLMDDFGSGYSSLNALKELDVYGVKLDYRFLSKESISNRKNKIVESIVNMLKSLELPIIAEGVEDKEDSSFLAQLGVHLIQGYLYGKPMTIEDFLSLKKVKLGDVETKFTQNPMYEILDQNSVANMIYNSNIFSSGIYDYNGKEIYPISQNKSLSKSDAFLDNDAITKKIDMFTLFTPKTLKNVRKYIDAVAHNANEEPYVTYEFAIEHGENQGKLSAKLLFSHEGHYTMYVETSVDRVLYHNEFDASIFLLDQLKALYDTYDEAICLLTESRKIIYFNNRYKNIFKDTTLGLSCEDLNLSICDCNQCPFQIIDNVTSLYIKELNILIKYIVRKLVVENEVCYLINIKEFNDLSDDNKPQLLNRMNVAMYDYFDVYTEVNLNKGTYEQINYRHGELYDAPIYGDYIPAYIHMRDDRIDSKNREELEATFSLESLRRESKNAKKVSCIYKLKETNIYMESIATFVRENGVTYACCCARNVTNQIMSKLEPFTGLYNRSAVEDNLNEYLRKNFENTLRFYMLDIDDFKEINDTYGHPMGDRVLKEIANVISNLSDKYDFMARLGGDEFTFSLKNVENVNLEKDYNQFVKDVAAIQQKLEIDIPISVSVGVAQYPQEGITFKELYLVADKRLYKNKLKHHLKTDEQRKQND